MAVDVSVRGGFKKLGGTCELEGQEREFAHWTS